jgi:hypothetical protein
MMVRFNVAPYALLDAVAALINAKDSHKYVNVTVTKEDNELVVIAEEVYYNTSLEEDPDEKKPMMPYPKPDPYE